MTSKTFSLEKLGKAKPVAAPKRATAKPKAGSEFPKTTPWGRKFLRQLDRLHKSLDQDGKKLA